MSAFSLFSPYSNLPDNPCDWVYTPPVLISVVGPGQYNAREDVRIVQQIMNIIIGFGYLEGTAVTPPQETGDYDEGLDYALGAVENQYLSGMASPFGPKIISNGSPLFAFIVLLAAGNTNPIRHYSQLMYQLARVMLPGAVAARNLAIYLPYILQALELNGLADTEMVLMALATIRAEDAGVVPISEGISKFNTSPSALRHQRGTHPFDLYDNRSDLGNQGPPDGANYRGRGFVQLTGRSNYAKYEKELGWPLIQRQSLANDPWVAAILLAKYMKNHESRIRTAVRNNDLRSARRAVNGGTHGLTEFTKAMRDGRAFLQQQVTAEIRTQLSAVAGAQ